MTHSHLFVSIRLLVRKSLLICNVNMGMYFDRQYPSHHDGARESARCGPKLEAEVGIGVTEA